MEQEEEVIMPFHPRLQAEKSGVYVNYHGRRGAPVIHFSQTVTRPTMKGARAYVMVRKEGGGTERLYLDSKLAGKEVKGITKLRKKAAQIKKKQMKKQSEWYQKQHGKRKR